jgi:hypothetical protein
MTGLFLETLACTVIVAVRRVKHKVCFPLIQNRGSIRSEHPIKVNPTASVCCNEEMLRDHSITLKRLDITIANHRKRVLNVTRRSTWVLCNAGRYADEIPD